MQREKILHSYHQIIRVLFSVKALVDISTLANDASFTTLFAKNNRKRMFFTLKLIFNCVFSYHRIRSLITDPTSDTIKCYGFVTPGRILDGNSPKLELSLDK